MKMSKWITKHTNVHLTEEKSTKKLNVASRACAAGDKEVIVIMRKPLAHH